MEVVAEEAIHVAGGPKALGGDAVLFRAAADIGGPDRGVPDTEGDGEGLGLGAMGAGQRDGRGGELVEESAGRKGTGGEDQMTIEKALPGGVDGGEEEAEGLVAGGKDDAEAIPGESAEVLVALGGPGFGGAEERPGGVVEGGFGEAGIVAGGEAPQAGEGGDGFAAGEEGEGGGRRGLGGEGDEGEEEGQEEDAAFGESHDRCGSV